MERKSLVILTFSFLVVCTTVLLLFWKPVFTSGTPGQQQEKGNRFETISDGSLPRLMVDKETGCQYVDNGNKTPYTLLYGPDGKPYCPNPDKGD